METPKITIERGKTDSYKDVVFTGLEAGALYTVEVQTVSGEQLSEKKTLEIGTCELFDKTFGLSKMCCITRKPVKTFSDQ